MKNAKPSRFKDLATLYKILACMPLKQPTFLQVYKEPTFKITKKDYVTPQD